MMNDARGDAQARMMLALDGLSVGDALGEQALRAAGRDRARMLDERIAPARAPWQWTDDTAMALALVHVLARMGRIDGDAFAGELLFRYAAEPWRGYGRGMHELFGEIAAGTPWHQAAPALFGGQGSLGNGAAMRVAPLGAYFAGDDAAALERVIEEAARSAAPTHAHPEGSAGAIAVAVAAARVYAGERDGAALLRACHDHTPPGETRERLRRVQKLAGADPLTVAAEVGNGSGVTAHDTVPFVLWCAAHHLGVYEAALWTCISVGGDVDTTCAMVGGIVAGAVGPAGIPTSWRAAREPLPPFALP